MGSPPALIRYVQADSWPEHVPSWSSVEVAGVAVDSQDNVYEFVRGEPPIRIFDAAGRALTSWGDGVFKRPHSIQVSGDEVLCVDDWGHSAYVFSTDGDLRSKLTRASDSDYPELADPDRPGTIVRAGPPFNYPTGAARAANRDIYVTDGYGNARVHRFSQEGQFKESWGTPGTGPMQFNLPHGVTIDKEDRLFVSDRLNKRVQVISTEGVFITEWEADWPNNVTFGPDGHAFVTELGSIFLFSEQADLSGTPARVTIRDLNGRVLAALAEEDPTGRGRFFSPHGIAVDSRADIYVSEVRDSYTRGQAPKDWPVIRKYLRAK